MSAIAAAGNGHRAGEEQAPSSPRASIRPAIGALAKKPYAMRMPRERADERAAPT